MVVIVKGKQEELTLKKKGKALGLLWMNLGSVHFKNVPNLYILYSSKGIMELAASESKTWEQLGIGFESDASQAVVLPERLLSISYPLMPRNPRLFWAVASWLAVHHQMVNGRLLVKELKALNIQDSAIAGVLLSVALELNPMASTLAQAVKHCVPTKDQDVLFDQNRQIPALAAIVRDESLALFIDWGFWHNQISDKRDAIRPVSWLIRTCPELRIRSLLGATLDAEIMMHVLVQAQTATDLMDDLPYTYAAIHEAATRLSDRGLLSRQSRGRAVVLDVPSGISKWLSKIPA